MLNYFNEEYMNIRKPSGFLILLAFMFSAIISYNGQAATTLDQPANDAHCVALDVQFLWSYTGAKTPTTYDFHLSRYPNFTDTLAFEKGLSSGSFDFDELLEFNTVYYWIGTVHFSDFSVESASGTFTTDGPPHLSGPADGAICVDYNTTVFSWQLMANADGYVLEVATDENFASVVQSSTFTPATQNSATITLPFDENTDYYWRVTADYTSLCGSSSTFSDVYTFHTEADPPSISAPAPAATCVRPGTVFDWSDVTGATGYEIQYSTSAVFTPAYTDIMDGLATSSYTYEAGDIDYATTYYWRVRGVFTSGCKTDWSTSSTFTTVEEPVTQVTPLNDAKGVSLNPTLIWQSAPPQPDSYDLQVSESSVYGTFVYNETGIVPSSTVTTSYELADPDLDYQETYYWRVRAHYGACTTDWSESRTFTTVYPSVMLNEPPNGMNCIDLNTEFSWIHTPPATAYRIQISEHSDMSSPEVDSAGIEGIKYNANLKKGSVYYYWRVRGEDEYSTGLWSEIRSFKSAYAPPTLIHPRNDSSAVPAVVTFTWASAGANARYYFELDTNAAFADPILQVDNLSATTTTQTMSNYFQTYYWRVRVVISGCASDWSDVYMFTTKLDVPTLVSPVNNSTKISTIPTLRWNKVIGATSYNFQIAVSNTFDQEDMVQNTSVLNNSGSSSKELSENAIYYWRVKAVNSRGESGWSTIWKFTTGKSAPETPVLLSPADNAENQPTTLTLTWKPTANALSYNLMVADNENMSSPIYDETGITQTSFEVTNLTNTTRYYWTVQAVGETGASPWAVPWNFRTITKVPQSKPTLVSPKDGLEGIPTTIKLVWDPVLGATSYEVQVATNSSFSTGTIVFSDDNVSTYFRYVTTLETSKTYYWRARGKNIAGTGPWSDTWMFTTTTVSVEDELLKQFNVTATPSPFSESTVIAMTLPQEDIVTARVYNALGQEVATLVNNRLMESGYNQIAWTPANIESGVYFVTIEVGDVKMTKQVVLTK